MRCASCFEQDSYENPLDDYDVLVIETDATVYNIRLCRECAEDDRELF